MEIELLRDLIIIISGLVVSLVIIVMAVISYSIYRRINGILKSVKNTAAEIEALTIITGDELGKPLIQVAAAIQGIACGVHAISKIFNKGG